MRRRDVLSRIAPVAILISGAILGSEARAEDDIHFDFSGHISIENRWFPQTNLYQHQSRHASGFVFEPELYFESAEGWSFNLVPFLRYDSADSRRTHADVREAYFLLFGELGDGEWELRLGVDRVFWGVIESNHLVDIINQVDLIEHPDLEVELGQLMVHATWSGEWGVAELFVLPHHRERTFPGRDGRLRTDFIVDEDHPTYESSAEQWHTDFALRYSHSFGPFDIGISVFDGTSREPLLEPKLILGPDGITPVPDCEPTCTLVPHYEQIRQFGLDAQITLDAWLLKLEAIHRSGAKNLSAREDDYAAFVAGAEYTFYSIFDSPADFSVLGEWNYDERGEDAANIFDDDLFFAIRYALNDIQDTAFLLTFMQDREHSTGVLFFEFDRRISDQWSMNVEAFHVVNADKKDIQIYPARRDSFVELRLNYNF